MSETFLIPARRCRVFETISRSRFITTIGHAADDAAAKQFIGKISSEFADASHNCWAYQTGPPGDTISIGMSDDGEPHGTAGRPMLTVLIHAGVGEIVSVVTRYFGGIKLGKGGLVRAYTSGVKQALEQLPTTYKQEFEVITGLFDYRHLREIRRICRTFKARIVDEVYAERIRLEIELPAGTRQAFEKEVSRF